MQSSQGILTAFLRTLLPRLGCGEEDVEFDFDMGVDGGAMPVFLALEIRTRSVKDLVEVWLEDNSGSIELSINLTASSPVSLTSATSAALFGPGKHINASCTLPPRVILRKLHQRQTPVAVQRPRRPSTCAVRTRAMLSVGLSKQTWQGGPLKRQKQRQAQTSSKRGVALVGSWKCFFGHRCRSPGQAESYSVQLGRLQGQIRGPDCTSASKVVR